MTLSPARPGYAFLVTVLVIGTIAASAVATLLLLSTSALRSTLSLESSAHAHEAATACAERALWELRGNLQYIGDETVTLSSGAECRVLPVGGSGNTGRTVCVEATHQSVIRRLEITVATVLPSTAITRWQEVSEFSLCDS